MVLTVTNLTYRVENRPILENTGFTAMNKWRVGVVGANGSGKSTLLKLIAGDLHMDAGEISLQRGLNLGMIKQDMPDDSMSLLDVVLSADKRRSALMHQVENEKDPYKLADIHEQLHAIDAYTGPARASSILSGLGFTTEQLSDPLSSLSGGWRMRVALAAALFQQPDVLLLDEPTNHLDIEGIMWLENYLANYPHTLLIVSHDREILNKCTDHILHVEEKALTMYTGNYDTFERERAERRAPQQKMHEKQQAQKAHMESFINRFRAKASKAKQAQSRIKMLERMEFVGAVADEHQLSFSFPEAEDIPPPLIALNEVTLGYGNNPPVLKGVDDRIDMDDRIALLGANGNGKSTLLKFIAGRLKAKAGGMHQSKKLRIGYFSQHQTDELNVDSTPFQEMQLLMKGGEAGARGRLGQFGFNKSLQDTPIKNLSGGEKSRLLFALISYNAPHLLILDEPTNHLDIGAREALMQALNTYNGAVLIVSHDPYMVERVADRLWLVQDGKVTDFDGDLRTYREMVVQNRRDQKRDERNSKTSDDGLTAKEQRVKAAEARKKLVPLKKEVEKAAKLVDKLTEKKKDIEAQLADPAIYDDNDTVKDLQFDYGQLLKEIDQAEAAWLEAETALEAAQP